MDRQKVQSFIKSAGVDLSSVRSNLLIAAQIGDTSDLMGSRHSLARLKTEAAEIGLSTVADMAADCEVALCQLAGTKSVSPHQANAALDAVARIEAALWNTPIESTDFLTDVSEFVDASFDELVPSPKETSDPTVAEFEIDEETLDVFRSEADELLANIVNDLRILSSSPADQNALWDIRRNAHTFKGAAGIVGLKNAAEAAHRMEDLLDKVVETGREPEPRLVEFLILSAGRLASIVAAKDGDDDGSLEKHYADLMATISAPKSENIKPERISNNANDAATPVQAEPARTTVTPVVRVSLDRLDELVGISRDLLENRADVAQYFSALGLSSGADSRVLAKLVSLFGEQRQLIEEIQAKLLHIRMVKFGTLETRLGRAINVTCLDENKKAALEIENGEVEIDTQVIDSLIEPLLHLLKNAVVHGIESPDTRRLIRKAERGTIRINIEVDKEAVILSVSDDGAGIAVHRLKEKALSTGSIDAETASSMTDSEAMQLIFDRGLTTAGKVDLNAGRGVGMSIVKESIESRGGTVLVESEPQRGTRFTIFMPLVSMKPRPDAVIPVEPVQQPDTSTQPLVLIVDDSASIRHQSSKIVREAGFRSVTASSVTEGLEVLRSADPGPAIILSDVEMPQIDGWKFLDYVKNNENFSRIPVVMVTSLDADTHRLRAFELGASDYIVKPFSSDSFEKALAKLGLSVTV